MKYLLLIIFLIIPSLSIADENAQRDDFVRYIVGVLIREEAQHISLKDHVTKAVEAWNHYQNLTKK